MKAIIWWYCTALFRATYTDNAVFIVNERVKESESRRCIPRTRYACNIYGNHIENFFEKQCGSTDGELYFGVPWTMNFQVCSNWICFKILGPRMMELYNFT